MALHHDLLEQARHLALREPRRPRQASLRRSVSATYYALFHLLAGEGAQRFTPKEPPLLRARLQRAFVHRDMREVCRRFAAGALPPATASLLAGPLQPELKQLASTFVELQDARHQADYDLATAFDRVDVRHKIDLATRAFLAWHSVRAHPNATVFLAALLLQRQWGA